MATCAVAERIRGSWPQSEWLLESEEGNAMLVPERYERAAGPAYSFDVDRRQFFQALGAGMIVLGLVDRSQAQESGRGGRRSGRQLPQEVSAWIHIGEDGTVSAFSGKAEV